MIYKQKEIATKQNVRNYKFRKTILMLHLLLIMLHYLSTMLHYSQNQRNQHRKNKKNNFLHFVLSLDVSTLKR